MLNLDKRSLTFTFLTIVIIGAIIFRIYDIEKRTFWNVDQSQMLWQVKSIIIDKKISLIGTHFFSLVNGAVYRTSIFNWLLAIPALLFGLKVKVYIYLFTLFAVFSLILTGIVTKKVGNGLAVRLSLIIYAFSWFIRTQEMSLWYAAPMILLSSVTSWLIFAAKRKKGILYGFILGLIMGMGFSLHFVIIWYIAALVIFWLLVDKTHIKSKLLGSFIGLSFMIFPLILFNARHEFVMKKGLLNMISGTAIQDQASLFQRIHKASFELLSLTGATFCDSCTRLEAKILLSGFILIGSILAFKKSRKFILFFAIQFFVAFAGLMYAGRMDYSSIHYVYYLIPLIVIIYSVFLEKLILSRFWYLGISLVILFLSMNVGKFNSYQDKNSYFYKKELAKYILTQSTQDKINIMFWDQETLAYDFVFYEVATELGYPYERVNLIERWGSDPPEMYIYLNEKPNVEGKRIEFGNNKLLISSSQL
jgi:hypothetical protein